MSFCRLTVSTLLGFATVLSTAVASAQRVVLVRPSSADAVLVEAFNRLRAELGLQDFEVVVIEASSESSSPDAIASAAGQQHAFAAIALARREGGRSADVWIADRVTGKITQRTLALEREEDAPSVLAVRAVDLLRSSLREFGPDQAPPPDVTGVDRGPVPEEVRAWARPAPPDYGLGVRAVALAPISGLGVAYGPSVTLRRRLSGPFRLGLGFAGPLIGGSFRATNGEAFVRQELGWLEGGIVVWEGERAAVATALGLGVYHLEARSEVDPPLVSQTDQVTSALASVGLALELKFTRAFAAEAGVTALALAPRPGVAIGDEQTLFQEPLLSAYVGVAVSF